MANSIAKKSAPRPNLTRRINKMVADPENTVLIDFPQEGEIIGEGDYAIRISATPESEVEISIDNGHWQPCRSAVGYWWADWQPVGSAQFKLVARARIGIGPWNKSSVRCCEIF